MFVQKNLRYSGNVPSAARGRVMQQLDLFTSRPIREIISDLKQRSRSRRIRVGVALIETGLTLIANSPSKSPAIKCRQDELRRK